MCTEALIIKQDDMQWEGRWGTDLFAGEARTGMMTKTGTLYISR